MQQGTASFARGRDRRDLVAAAGAHTQEKAAQRARRLRARPGVLDQHPARLRPVLLGLHVVLRSCSWRFFERPINGLKRRSAYQDLREDAVPAAVPSAAG